MPYRRCWKSCCSSTSATVLCVGNNDSLKYALKTLETVLYELSVAGAVGGHENLVSKEDTAGNGCPAKRMKIDGGDKGEDATMEEAGDD